MSDRDELLALAERCEQASGPDRRLDAEIAIVGKVVPYDFEPAFGVACWRAIYDNRYWDAPEYTASLDAALTLVLDGATVDIFINRCVIADKTVCEVQHKTAVAATPALALCAAALRAKAGAA